MFSDISLEERVPASHPLRKLRGVVDALLATMNREFEAVYARRGRPSVPPEMLLKVPPARQRRTHESTADADTRLFKKSPGDKGYDCKAFITGCRRLKVTPHVAAKDKHSAVDGRIRRHEGYQTWQHRWLVGRASCVKQEGQCAQNGRDGLKTGLGDDRNRRATPSELPQASKSGGAACLIGTFSTAC
jgi:hypothetical protein